MKVSLTFGRCFPFSRCSTNWIWFVHVMFTICFFQFLHQKASSQIGSCQSTHTINHFYHILFLYIYVLNTIYKTEHSLIIYIYKILYIICSMFSFIIYSKLTTHSWNVPRKPRRGEPPPSDVEPGSPAVVGSGIVSGAPNGGFPPWSPCPRESFILRKSQLSQPKNANPIFHWFGE